MTHNSLQLINPWPSNSRSNWNLEMLVFEEGRKLENPEKNPWSKGENQQQTQSTYDAGSGNRTRATLVVGKRCHHCPTPTPPVWISSLVFALCSMLLDKKFKSELVRFGAEAAAKLGTRSNRYETLLKQRHVQVSESCLFHGQFFLLVFYGSTLNTQVKTLERLSMTFTANGKNETFAVCRQLSVQ